MSTEIKTIKGRYEESCNNFNSNYGDSNISLTRFDGGKKGPMLQITISNDKDNSHIQLTVCK